MQAFAKPIPAERAIARVPKIEDTADVRQPRSSADPRRSALDRPFGGRSEGRDLRDRRLGEDRTLGLSDAIPNRREGSRDRFVLRFRRLFGTVDRGQDLGEGDAIRGPREPVTPRRAPRARHQTRSLQLKQDLHKVTLGNLMAFGDRSNAHGRLVGAVSRQFQHRQTRVFRLRRDLKHG